jgi:hypothetical protein
MRKENRVLLTGMNEFVRENSIGVVLVLLGLFYLATFLLVKRRQASADSFLAKIRADAEEYKRHNGAVEQKLDRIISLLEQRRDGGG